ncbi:hypothetical protein HDU87_004466 [Geranomyces variabilis]|uniref:Uncharacterized protein n=1 Tax=Geranomyces variabilis TaxID=109894 RepID=A0AAD5XMH4_9FUNG|nr:hypothetical protein HDU87_004466 [Geranomyces variabilis]
MSPEPPPPGRPPFSARVRTAVYCLVTGLFLVSPFSILTACILYVFLMLAVAAYAAYIALKEFIREDLLKGTAFAWDATDADASAVANPGAISDEIDLPAFLRNSQVLQTLFLGPPLLVYVSSRGAVTAALHLVRWTFWQTVFAVPSLARGVRWTAVAMFNLAQDIGGVVQTVWTFMKRPVVEIATTIAGVAKSCANACLAVARAFRQLAEDAVALAYRAAVMAWTAAAALVRPFTLFASAIYEFITPPIRAVVRGMHIAVYYTLSLLEPIVARITNSLLCFASSIGPALSALIAGIARLGEKALALADAYVLPPIKQLAAVAISSLATLQTFLSFTLAACATAARRVMTGIIHPFAVMFPRMASAIHATFARMGIYAFVINLPDQLVHLLDAACHSLETGISYVARLTWRVTMRVHALASPIFRALLTAVTPLWAAALTLAAWCFSVAESYTQAAANAARAALAAVGVVYLWALTEVERAAHRAVKAGDTVGQHIARLGSASSSPVVKLSAKLD